MHARFMLPRTLLAPLAARPDASQAAISETEPNNTPNAANPVQLGDVIAGTIGALNDEDWYRLDLPAGVILDVDVDAQSNGSALDPVIAVYRTNGQLVAVSDDVSSLDSRARVYIEQGGSFYVGIANSVFGAGPEYHYSMTMRQQPLRAGDPMPVISRQLNLPIGVIASSDGAILVADPDANAIRRIDPITGATTNAVTFASGSIPIHVIYDGYGDLLVSGQDNAGSPIVWKIRDGQPVRFLSNFFNADAMTLGPDGDIYLSDPIARRMHRYDPLGTLKETINLNNIVAVPFFLAFSPAGELHFSTLFFGVYKVVNGQAVRVIEPPFVSGGLAFDALGQLYVAGVYEGTIALYDSDYSLIDEAIATTPLGPPVNLSFAKTSSTAMSNRLYVLTLPFSAFSPEGASLTQVKTTATPNAGFPVGVELLTFLTTSLSPTALMGEEYSETVRISGSGTYAFRIASGTLPPGLQLSQTGVIAGVPTVAGQYRFTVRAESATQFGLWNFALTVGQPAVAIEDASNALFGVVTALSPARKRYLDLIGNNNGRYDVGDFRAYLRLIAQLPVPTTKRQPATVQVKK